MKKKSFWKDTVIVGLALFSTMFGAGNLIFPPQIGLFSGTGVVPRCYGPAAGWHRSAGYGSLGG